MLFAKTWFPFMLVELLQDSDELESSLDLVDDDALEENMEEKGVPPLLS